MKSLLSHRRRIDGGGDLQQTDLVSITARSGTQLPEMYFEYLR